MSNPPPKEEKKPPPLTGWIRTANNCGKHGQILYVRFATKGGKPRVMACPECPGGPTFGEHTEDQVHEDF